MNLLVRSKRVVAISDLYVTNDGKEMTKKTQLKRKSSSQRTEKGPLSLGFNRRGKERKESEIWAVLLCLLPFSLNLPVPHSHNCPIIVQSLISNLHFMILVVSRALIFHNSFSGLSKRRASLMLACFLPLLSLLFPYFY